MCAPLRYGVSVSWIHTDRLWFPTRWDMPHPSAFVKSLLRTVVNFSQVRNKRETRHCTIQKSLLVWFCYTSEHTEQWKQGSSRDFPSVAFAFSGSTTLLSRAHLALRTHRQRVLEIRTHSPR